MPRRWSGLDLATGLLTLRYTLQQGGGRLRVEEERFFFAGKPGAFASAHDALAARRHGAWAGERRGAGLLQPACAGRPGERAAKRCASDCTAAVERPGAGVRPGYRPCGAAGAARAQGLGEAKRFTARARRSAPALRRAPRLEVRCGWKKAAAIATSRDLDPLLAPLPQGWAFDELLQEKPLCLGAKGGPD